MGLLKLSRPPDGNHGSERPALVSAGTPPILRTCNELPLTCTKRRKNKRNKKQQVNEQAFPYARHQGVSTRAFEIELSLIVRPFRSFHSGYLCIRASVPASNSDSIPVRASWYQLHMTASQIVDRFRGHRCKKIYTHQFSTNLPKLGDKLSQIEWANYSHPKKFHMFT